jgi:LAS superfamily LD-carboxypeptidase LdcB
MDDLTLQLTGKTQDHVARETLSGQWIHKDVLGPFQQLRSDSIKKGFRIEILSGFRDYAHQKRIWNAKADGTRQLLDEQGHHLDPKKLNDEQKLFAILKWSAVPGASRHHWGTEIDIYDGSTVESREDVSLVPNESLPGGLFHPLHCWLDERISSNEAHGFFRPYTKESGSVAPERWHLSYAPLSKKFHEKYSFDLFVSTIESDPDLALQELLLKHARKIFDRYVV